MKKLIQQLIFGKPRTEDVEQGNFLYEHSDLSRAGKLTIPGDIPYEEWQNGAWSKYLHPDCKLRILKAV